MDKSSAGRGGFRLEMEGEDQAKKALPIVQSYFKGIDAYEEEIAQDGNIIEVDFEIGLDADE